jgi:uncharacterized tellurite resistance protein B-like protein
MIVVGQPVGADNREAAQKHLDELLQVLAKPGGYAKLTTQQRKFLLGVILAAIVPADKRIRHVEVDHLQVLLKTALNVAGDTALESMALAEGTTDLRTHIETLAKALPDLLGIEDRSNLIAQLWELALCDHELHTFEEQLVYKVADLSDVPRKKVAELMARAAAKV